LLEIITSQTPQQFNKSNHKFQKRRPGKIVGELNGLFHPSHDCSSKIARVGALNMSLQVESLVSVQ
jgi:hypothetical protein